MTLVVLGLDALDAGLIDHFGLDGFKLETSAEIETYAYSRDVPYTLEVWPSVATGVGPDEHGIVDAGTSEWSNPVLELGSRVTGRLAEGTRGKLGRLVRNYTGEREQLATTDVASIFDEEGAVVRNWPGVHGGSDLQYAWDLMYDVAEDMPKDEFERKLLGLCAEQFGWAREMLHHEVRLAGVHIHTLDAAGHAYAGSESDLEAMYRRTSEFVAELVAALGPDDDVLIVSDHGMHTPFYDGERGHSWRAFASTTADSVPEDVMDVADWVRTRLPEHDVRPDRDDVDLPMQELRDLGYVE
ncbi:alkaline phosphatase family protein [Haloplanus sp. C73]|uniref:alkaline phosphatase family protein n=1 Tax=Haloplanus sp. C73 TaxID=3421641 RepID=UPI003EBC602F